MKYTGITGQTARADIHMTRENGTQHITNGESDRRSGKDRGKCWNSFRNCLHEQIFSLI